MFDISFIEILVVSIVALVVLGPERLPKVARTIGHLLGRVRRYINEVKVDIHNEMRLDELKNLHTSVKETAQSIENTVRQEVEEIKSMTDVEGFSKTDASSSTEVKTDAESRIDTAAPSAQSASQQQTSKSSEQKRSALEKDNK